MTIEGISVPLRLEVPMQDNFTSEEPLPLFLRDRADEHQQRVASRLPKASIMVIAAAIGGSAIALSLGNPVKLFADVTAPPTDMSALRPGIDQLTPAIQSTAHTQALPPTAREAATHDEIAATFEPADQSQSRIREALSEAWLKQFQTWAANEDARVQAEPVHPVQNAQAQVSQDDRAPVRPVRKQRRVRPVQNARAEIRSVENPRARIRRDQDARVVRHAQDGRAQDQSVQNGQAPSQGLGWRD